MHSFYRFLSIFIGFILCLGGCSSARQKPGHGFTSPEQAVAELHSAIQTRDRSATIKLLGLEGDELVLSGEEELDRKRVDRFNKAYAQAHTLEPDASGRYVLLIGKQRWPFPIPLVKQDDLWYFDAEAGREELLNRIIGENELEAMRISKAISYAQILYAAKDRDGDGLREYAQKIRSSEGQPDGLFWPVKEGEEVSPLGPIVAEAGIDSTHSTSSDGPQPYSGYIFKILPRTKPSTDLSNLQDGFWIIAQPDRYSETGVMSFAADHLGRLYETDAGDSQNDLVPPSISGTEDNWVRIE